MRLCVLVFVVAAVARLVAEQATDNAPRVPGTVWDGAYSLAQAERGQNSYRAYCADCHRDDLRGYSSLLVGQRFMDKYSEASLDLFFDKVKTTMPRNAPASLDDETYVDIVSYILKVNDFPSGDRELAVADLASVRLVGKGGPGPVPNFSLVRVVGCLTPRGDGWIVANSTEPARTGRPQPAPDEAIGATNPPSGTATFELMSFAAYEPAKHARRIVELRGFLIRRPEDSRINVTSITPVGPVCAPEASSQ
jgi:mono/diheme cytochrome c family protein